MHLLLSISLIVLLLGIVYHDFTRLTIPIYLLGLSILLSLVILLTETKTSLGLGYFGLNLLATFIMLTISTLVLAGFKKRLLQPVNTIIGSGDLVFFVVIAACFSPFNFIVFFILSIILTLTLKIVFLQTKNGVPLAGGQALALAFIQIAVSTGFIDTYSDVWTINLLLGL